jgi:hypothetical protein
LLVVVLGVCFLRIFRLDFTAPRFGGFFSVRRMPALLRLGLSYSGLPFGVCGVGGVFTLRHKFSSWWD